MTSRAMSFTLDNKTLMHHRAGQALALASSAIGRAFAVVRGPTTPTLVPMARRTEDNVPKRPRSQIAVIDVFGPLSQRSETYCGWIDGYDSIAARVNEELGKPDVGAVLLRLDSPGGDVAGLEECIRSIVANRDATGKPIAAYVDELAASGAYWLACGVTNAGIFAPRSGNVGSVGVYTMLADERKSLEQEGIALTLVRDPPGKDAANPYSPVEDVALARATDVVNAHAARFYAAVGAARGMTPERVRGLNAAVLLADAAKAAGLIDEVLSIDDAISRLAAKAAESSMGRPVSAGQHTTKRGTGVRHVGTPQRRASMAGNMPKVADAPAPAEDQPAESGRATAADVSQECTACAQVCTDCATACDSGTADEAIAATEATIAACEACIKVCKSFLGASSMPDDDPEPDKPDEQSASSTDARVISLLESIEREHAEERRAKQLAAEAEERKTLIASRQIVNKAARAWLENPKTPIQSVRDACRVLPPAQVPNLAADVTTGATRGAGDHGLSEHELKICKEAGCKPEDFAALKAQRRS